MLYYDIYIFSFFFLPFLFTVITLNFFFFWKNYDSRASSIFYYLSFLILHIYPFSISRTRNPLCFLPRWSLLFSYFLLYYFFLLSRTVIFFSASSPFALIAFSVSYSSLTLFFGSLLTLSSFTRFSLRCLHPASLHSLILLPILTLLPPSLLLSFCPLYSHSLPSRTLPEAILLSFSWVSRQSVSPSHYPLLVSL